MAPRLHDDRAPVWDHDVVEETLDDARLLTVAATDRIVCGWWEELARLAGIPPRRWRQHHPLGRGDDAERIIALVDGRPAFNTAAWARFASLVPGAVATPTRTAAAMSVARSQLRPPGRPPPRVLDLWRARRRAAHLRRAERTLDGDLAAFRYQLDRQLTGALAPGEDGTAFAALPTYALATRFEDLLHTDGRWGPPVLVDLAAGEATVRLMRLLGDRGVAGEDVVGVATRYASGGGVASGRHVERLAKVAGATGADRERLLAAWLTEDGWHALRDLHLEARPLRDAPEVVRGWLDGAPWQRASPAAPSEVVDDPPLRHAVQRARHLTTLREVIARDRADLHAALRAIAWTLGARLVEQGNLRVVDDAFGLSVDALMALARGAEVQAPLSSPTNVMRAALAPSRIAPAKSGTVLHGIPVSAGIAAGRVVVLDDPLAAADLDGAVLVCRLTDPAWMPLLLRCSALVTERGGPLSHAAIVAREIGLPAVVAVPGARALAGNTRRARVDGGTGTVTLDPEA